MNTDFIQILEKFAIDFIEKHFNEIDLISCDWNIKTKEEAIKDIKELPYMAGWIITEVMVWGISENNYIAPYMVDNENNDFIIKIEERFFMIDGEDRNFFTEVFPKKIVIEKIIFDHKQ